MKTFRNPIFCAIDTPDVAYACRMVERIRDHVGGIKIGLEFFMANGAAGYRPLAEMNLPIFLDVKLHDIPNTVKGAVQSLLPLAPTFMTIHTAGGAAMMRSAAQAASQAGENRPKLLGVTVLTSMDTQDLKEVGQDVDVNAQVKRLALLAKDSGLDGVICAPTEVAMLRQACGPDFVLMVPGIRPVWSASNDQKRVMTPEQALKDGASCLVIGRPITGAEDPAAAAQRLAAEIAKA